MPTFTPPVGEGIPWLHPEATGAERELMKFYTSCPMGITVWKDLNDVWHQQQYPTDTNFQIWKDNAQPNNAKVVYHGGHTYAITQAAADELESAGFGEGVLTLGSITESFNKADGSLGPDLTWTRQIFSHQFPFTVASNQVQLFADAAGTWEDAQKPFPNVDGSNVLVTLAVNNITRGLGAGSPNYVIDIGCVVRTEIHGTDYRGYAAGIGRNNIFFPPAHTYHLAIFRVDSRANANLIGIALLPLASVSLPGTFTFAAQGPNFTAQFFHGGGGGTMQVNVEDNRYTDGFTMFGGSVVITSGDTGLIQADSFQAVAL